MRMRRRVTWICENGEPAQPAWNAVPSSHPSRIDYLRLLEDDETSASARTSLMKYYSEQSETWSDWVRDETTYFDGVGRAFSIIGRSPSRVLEVAAGSVSCSQNYNPGALWVSTDISLKMLLNSQAPTAKVAADSFRLPFRSGSFDLIVGLNAVCWPPEAVRVLMTEGILALLYSYGEHTPIYASPLVILKRCPPTWSSIALTGSYGEIHLFGEANELSNMLSGCIPS